MQHKLCVYSQPSVFTGSVATDSTNCELKTVKKTPYVVAALYYVIRPMIVVSVLNIHILFLVIIL